MKGLNRTFCEKVWKARREAGLSQTELAAEIGCKQSALSPFERGDGTKLSDAAIKKLSEKFGIPLSIEEEINETPHPQAPVFQSTVAGSGFCPNPDCPGNRRVSVGGEVFLFPDRKTVDPVGARFCACCGEILERKCPNCGSPVHDGAVCSFCGGKYLTL